MEGDGMSEHYEVFSGSKYSLMLSKYKTLYSKQELDEFKTESVKNAPEGHVIEVYKVTKRRVWKFTGKGRKA